MDLKPFAGGEIFNPNFPVFLLLVPILLVAIKQKLIPTSKRKPLPPGPTPLPIIGNIHQLGKNLHISLAKFANTHGPLISLKLGSQFLVVASSPAAATEILKTHDRNLSARYPLQVNSFDGSDLSRLSMMWSPECGERWKFLRGLCKNNLFSAKVIESQAVVRAETAAEMVEFLGRNEGKVVKIWDVIYLTIMNTMTTILSSKKFNRMADVQSSVGGDITEKCVVKSGEKQFNHDLSNRGRDVTEKGADSDGLKGRMVRLVELGTAPNVADLYPILAGLDLHRLTKRLGVMKKECRDIWKDVIDSKRESHSHGSLEIKDFMDVLITNQFSDEEINHLYLELVLAGTDNTTATIEWAMAELVKNRESMKKLQLELETQINRKNPINETTLSKLPYLQACLKETLRLHPPGPFLLPHRSIEHCEIMNYTIPKNSMVFVNVWAIGRDPLVWKDASDFNPDRFLDSNMNFKGQDFELLPFGAGRRICPGLPMATNQLGLIIATLVHKFDWCLVDGEDPALLDTNEKLAVSLRKEKPLMIIPTKKF